jgi:hypothetical protein
LKELIDAHQAHLLMLAVLGLAPLVGLLWGVITKRAVRGLVIGILVGGGNFALWTLYNTITDKLGLDTVKNLLTNLCLFIVLGVAIGVGASWFASRERTVLAAQGGDDGDVARDRTG